MNDNSFNNYREIQYSTDLCRIKEDGQYVFTNPLAFLHGSVLVVPDKVRIPDGTVLNDIWFDEGALAYAFWHNNNNIRMIAGKALARIIEDYYCGWISSWKELIGKIQFPGLSDIALFDEEIQMDYSLLLTSNHGILYSEKDVAFVPCCNQYANSQPDETDEKKVLNESLITEIKDPFGGVYSLDGTKFLRWEGSSKIDTYTVLHGVKEICNSAFRCGEVVGFGYHGISANEILLPNTLEKIGDYAFSVATIGKIVLPKSLKSIGKGTFFNCHLQDIVIIPDEVETIDEMAFQLSDLKELWIGQKVEYIGSDCFKCCDCLASIEVDSKNEYFSSVEGVLFDKYCKQLITVPKGKIRSKDDPESVIVYEAPIIAKESGSVHFKNLIEGVSFKHIHDTSSFNQNNFQYPKLPIYEIISNDSSKTPIIEIKYDKAYVDEIGNLCDNLTICPPRRSLVFLENGTHFQEGELICQYPKVDFYNFNPKYTLRLHFAIPQTVEIIEPSAFSRCTFEELIIPDSVKILKRGCFDYCDTSLLVIGKYARFEWNDELSISAKRIIVDPKNPNHTLIDGVMYDKEGRNLILCPSEKKELDIPFGVETIYPNAFNRCKLRRLTMPSSLTVLFDNAFQGSDIKEITLSPNLCKIGNSALSIYNDYLKINIPRSLREMYKKHHIPIYSGNFGSNIDERIVDSLEDGNSSTTLCIDELPEDEGYKYVPVGSWQYFNKLQDKGYETSDTEQFQFVEISRAQIIWHLERLKDYFVDIAQQNPGIRFQYYPDLNDNNRPSASIKFVDGHILRFILNNDIVDSNIGSAGSILSFLGLEIDDYLQSQEKFMRYEKSSETFKDIIGKEVCHHVIATWKEDIVDENTGEVVTVDRSQLVANSRQIITQEIFDTISLCKDIDHIYINENDGYGYRGLSILEDLFLYNDSKISASHLYQRITECDDSCMEQIETEEMSPVIVNYLCPDMSEEGRSGLNNRILKKDYLHIFEEIFNGYYKGYFSPETIDFHIMKVSNSGVSSSQKDLELVSAISKFFDGKINRLKQCQNEEDAFSLFLIEEDLLIELRTYLSKKGLPYKFIF